MLKEVSPGEILRDSCKKIKQYITRCGDHTSCKRFKISSINKTGQLSYLSTRLPLEQFSLHPLSTNVILPSYREA